MGVRSRVLFYTALTLRAQVVVGYKILLLMGFILKVHKNGDPLLNNSVFHLSLAYKCMAYLWIALRYWCILFSGSS